MPADFSRIDTHDFALRFDRGGGLRFGPDQWGNAVDLARAVWMVLTRPKGGRGNIREALIRLGRDGSRVESEGRRCRFDSSQAARSGRIRHFCLRAHLDFGRRRQLRLIHAKGRFSQHRRKAQAFRRSGRARDLAYQKGRGLLGGLGDEFRPDQWRSRWRGGRLRRRGGRGEWDRGGHGRGSRGRLLCKFVEQFVGEARWRSDGGLDFGLSRGAGRSDLAPGIHCGHDVEDAASLQLLGGKVSWRERSLGRGARRGEPLIRRRP